MSPQLPLIAITHDSGAAAWAQASLKQGNGLSAAVIDAGLLTRGRYFALVPPELGGRVPPLDQGGVVLASDADRAVTLILADVVEGGGRVLVVESDVYRRGDLAVHSVSAPAAYIDDRVVYWCGLTDEVSRAAPELLRRAAAGYPTNGFVLDNDAAALGLLDEAVLDPAWCVDSARSVLAIFFGAFDGESYLLWLRQGVHLLRAQG